MRVKITPGMEVHALFAESEKLKHNPSTYTKFQIEHANYYGSLGELGVSYMFGVKESTGLYAPLYDGDGDDGDIFVTIKGEPKQIEVKTATHPYGDYFFVTKVLWDKPGDPYYISVAIDNGWLRVRGWTYKNAFKLATKEMTKNSVPTMYVPLEDLIPIEVLIDKIDRGVFIGRIPGQTKDNQVPV